VTLLLPKIFVEKKLTKFSAGGAAENSPQHELWVLNSPIVKAPPGATENHYSNLFRPIRGFARFAFDTHGFTVGYYRSSLRDGINGILLNVFSSRGRSPHQYKFNS
jgi:hypothetical protein